MTFLKVRYAILLSEDLKVLTIVKTYLINMKENAEQ